MKIQCNSCGEKMKIQCMACGSQAQPLVRGLNWAPDSEEDEEMPGSVLIVQMSVAEDADDVANIAEALLQLASTEEYVFDMHKGAHEVAKLFMPVMFPFMDGKHDDDVHEGALSLFWISNIKVKFKLHFCTNKTQHTSTCTKTHHPILIIYMMLHAVRQQLRQPETHHNRSE